MTEGIMKPYSPSFDSQALSPKHVIGFYEQTINNKTTSQASPPNTPI